MLFEGWNKGDRDLEEVGFTYSPRYRWKIGDIKVWRELWDIH